MAKLTREQEQRHAQACQLVDLHRDLTEDEREFVLQHWLASSTTTSASDRAYFTPAGLARDMSVEVGGDRVIDLCAGIGRLAWAARDLWPGPGRELVCLERDAEYVRVGRRVLPEARWICADVMDLPTMFDDLGTFSCALSNPPFGAIPRSGNGPGGYVGRRFEYHVIALAGLVAHSGVFLVPETSASFRYSRRPCMEPDRGDAEYDKFVAATGIELGPNCGIDTSGYDAEWVGDVSPRVEIVLADFTASRPSLRAAAAATTARNDSQQLALLG